MVSGEPLKRYFSVRWTWWENHSLTELREALKGFTLTIMPADTGPLSSITVPIILEAKADTLHTLLSKVRAILFQKRGSGGALTEKDKALKEAVFKLYPRWQSTPLSIHAPVEYWINDK